MSGFRWIVCGGRDFTDRAYLHAKLDEIAAREGLPTFFISGGAPGADEHAEGWRQDRLLPGVVLKADWDAHGNSAGHKRNSLMLTSLRLWPKARKLVIAFRGGDGTANMVEQALAAGVEVLRVPGP